MTNHKEILRLNALGFSSRQIADSCGCHHSTASRTVAQARELGLTWEIAKDLSAKEVSVRLRPSEAIRQQRRMPDYEYVHKEMQLRIYYRRNAIVNPCRVSFYV